jgi:hypothetical protein
MIAEIIAENSFNCKLKRMAVESLSDGFYGSEKFLYQKNLLSSKAVESEVLKLLN